MRSNNIKFRRKKKIQIIKFHISTKTTIESSLRWPLYNFEIILFLENLFSKKLSFEIENLQFSWFKDWKDKKYNYLDNIVAKTSSDEWGFPV